MKMCLLWGRAVIVFVCLFVFFKAVAMMTCMLSLRGGVPSFGVVLGGGNWPGCLFAEMLGSLA